MIGAIRSWTRANRLTTRCLVLWLMLLPLTIWIGTREDFSSALLNGLIGGLVGSLGSVVIAAFFVDRWRAAEEHRERAEWLQRNEAMITAGHKAVRGYLNDIVTMTYAVVAPLLAEQYRVPARFLVADIERLPALDDDSPDSRTRMLSEVIELRMSGPLAYAEDQASALYGLSADESVAASDAYGAALVANGLDDERSAGETADDGQVDSPFHAGVEAPFPESMVIAADVSARACHVSCVRTECLLTNWSVSHYNPSREVGDQDV